jgi:uncharacterized protein (DUF1330 family)
VSAYVIVDIDVFDEEQYAIYRKLAPRTVSEHGGKYLIRGGPMELLEGGSLPKRFVVLEFPSISAVKRWWNSQEYQELKLIRQASTNTNMFVIEGVEENNA